MARKKLEVVITGDSKGAEKAFGDVDKAAERSESKFREIGGRLADVGKVVGVTAAVALAAGFASTLSFDAGNDKLAASLGLNEVQSQIAGQVAGSLYADAYGGSMAEVQGAIAAVGSSLVDLNTVSAGELEKLTANALDFTAAFDADLDRVVSNAQVLMTSGLAGSAQEAFDLMTAAWQATPIGQRDELSDATQEYSQFFAQLGFSGEAAFGALTAAASGGQYVLDKTGDAIKEFTIRATDMSAGTVAAFDAIGLPAQKMANDILAGGDTAAGAMSKIVQGLLAIKDPATRANAAIALFGTPLEDIGTDKIPQFLASLDPLGEGLGDVTGAAERMGDTLNDNLATKLTSVWRSIEMGLVSVINFATPAVESFVGFLGGVVDQIDWAGAFETARAAVQPLLDIDWGAVFGRAQAFVMPVVDALGRLGAAVGELVEKALPRIVSGFESIRPTIEPIGLFLRDVLVGSITAVADGVSWLADNFGFLEPILVAVAAGFVTLKTAQLATQAAYAVVTAAQWAFNAALNANPISLIVLAIGALIGALVWAYNNVDWFRNAVDAAWSAIQTAISWAWNTVIKPVWDAIWGFVETKLIPVLQDLWSKATEVWNGVAADATYAWENWLRPAFEAISGFVETKLIPIVQAWWETNQLIWGFVADKVGWAWDTVIRPIWDALWGFVSDKLVPVVQWWWETNRAVWDQVVGAVQWAWGPISTVFGWLRDGFLSVADFFGAKVTDVVNIFTWMGNAIRGAFESAFNFVKDLWNRTAGGFGFSIPDWVPLIGGNKFEIPRMHTGGVFDADTPGGEGLALLRDGERIMTPTQMPRHSDRPPAGSPVVEETHVHVTVHGSVLSERDLVGVLDRYVRRGGRVVVA